MDPGYADVTLEALLQHRGGAPVDIPSDILSGMWSDGAAPDARIKAVRALLARPPAQPPGTFAYSNAGYIIAGAALERAVGSTWEQLLDADLFGPLRMASCGFGAPGTPGPIDEPWWHALVGGVLQPVPPGPEADNPPAMGPAGTVHCSLPDWGRFLSLHLAGGRGDSTLVSPATMAKMQTPPPGGDYADGWVVEEPIWAGGTALTHAGSNTLWFAVAWVAPQKNIAFAITTNRAEGMTETLLDGAFAALLQAYAR